MKHSLHLTAALFLYRLLWNIAIPILRFNPLLRVNRLLRDGFVQRLAKKPLPKADLWIQAASAGEAYLAIEIIKQLQPASPIEILLSTTMRQGMDIFKKASNDLSLNKNISSINHVFFPFDSPAIMKRALRSIEPKVVILLESELWPGLLSACKKTATKVALINGRMSEKSLKRYMFWPSFWRQLKPDGILAISDNDAERFAVLFGKKNVSRMSNIKFDRFMLDEESGHGKNPLSTLIPKDSKFIILGSVRKEEEDAIIKVIQEMYRKKKETIVGLFPRHPERIKCWGKNLTRLKIKWVYRSTLNKHVDKGTLILWDTFGELPFAYEIARSAFVGGSLAPLGGQNFLEPLTCGIKPITGPDWSDFSWVGNDIIKEGLLITVNNWQELSKELITQMDNPQDREKVRTKALEYIKKHQGGTRQACQKITQLLDL
jgi:3-deoxy-D-manno-octulosonic-acid transferase